MIMTAKPFANMVDRFEGGFQQAEHTFPGAMPVTLPTACGAQTCSSPPSLALACPRSGEQTQPSWAVCPPQDAHSDFSRGWRASAPFPPAKESFDCGLVHSEQYMYPSVPSLLPTCSRQPLFCPPLGQYRMLLLQCLLLFLLGMGRQIFSATRQHKDPQRRKLSASLNQHHG